MGPSVKNGIFWREPSPDEDPSLRAEALFKRAPSMLPRFVTYEQAMEYAHRARTEIELAFRLGVVKLVFSKTGK